MTFQELCDKHLPNHNFSENFDVDWKLTEILYCKIGWCIDIIPDLEEHVTILLEIQEFLEDLQQLEARPNEVL
jgi:hypothetical protein